MSEYERTQEDEMSLALKENRQPMCVYCASPLDRILQTQYENLEWEWDKVSKRYVKREHDGDADEPYHSACGAEDWDFVDFKLVRY